MKTHFLIKSRSFYILPPTSLLVVIILLLWWIITFPSLAQTKVWDKTLGGDNYDGLRAMVTTPDGGYLLGGESTSGKTGDKSKDNWGTKDGNGDYPNDYWIVKLDANGKKIWDKTLGGNGYDGLKAIVATPDGGYLLGGSSNSVISGDKSESPRGKLDEMGNHNPDYWLVKIDANGNKIWDKSFGGEGYENLTALIATADGGYLLGGDSNSRIGYDKSEENRGCSNGGYCWGSDYWIVKIDANGKKAWDKTLGTTSYDNLYALAVAPEGGYVVGGSTGSGISGDKTEESKDVSTGNGNEVGDYWLVKLDVKGKKVWDKTIGGASRDELYSILLTADGSYLLGGYSISRKSGNKSGSYSGYWVVKVNPKGEKIWDKSYGGSGSDYFKTMIATPDGGYLLGGYSYRGIGGDKSEEKTGYWIVKIKQDGTKVWEKAYSSGELAALLVAPDGDYLLGGLSSSGITEDKSEKNRTPEGEYPTEDYWVVKIKENKHNQKGQTITLPTSLLVKTIGEAPFILTAKASSGLPVTFSLVSGPAILSKNKLTLTGVGTIKLKATQAGNDGYKPAPEVMQTIIVDPVTPINKLWDKRFGGERNDYLADIIATPDGGYLLGGSSNSGIGGDKTEARRDNDDYWVIKIDSDRNKEWDLTLGDTGGYGDEHLSKVLATADGGYLVAGTYYSASIDGTFYQYWIIKINSKGKQEWEAGFGNEASLATMIATADGGYLLGGTASSNSTKTEAPRGENDYWVVKIDANGKKVWDKTYGGSKWDALTTILATPDGGYLLGGNSGSGKSGDKSERNRGTVDIYGSPSPDYWLVKIDAKGKILWDKTLGGDKWDALTALLVTSDGGYLVGGSSISGKNGDKSEASRDIPTENYWEINDYWVVKLNARGQKVWDKTLGGSGNDGLAAMLAVPDGGYLLGGSSNSGIGQDKTGESRGSKGVIDGDYWLIKLDGNGKIKWDKTLGGDGNENLAALKTAPDGNYLLGGTSRSEATGDKSEPDRSNSNSGRGDYWIIKVKEELPLTAQWNMRYGGSGNEGFTTIIKTSDSGYLSGGYSGSGVSGDKTQTSQGKNDYWIVKSDPNGKKLWDKSYGGSGDDYLNWIIPTKDGGYLLAGSSLSGKNGDKTEASRGDRDYWIVKIDKSGTKQWDKTYGGGGYEELKKVLQLSTGEYILAGYSNSPVSGEKSQASQGNTDYWLVKISSTGTKLWDRRYGGSLEEVLGGIVQTADGGYLLGGSSWSGKNGNKTEASRGKSDFWLVQVDKEGKQLWDKTYGGMGIDEAYSVGKSGSTYFIAGQSDSPAGGDKTRDPQGGLDYWLLKVTSTGEKVWDKRYGGEKDDELRTSIQTQDGGYLLAGKSFSDKSGNKRQDSQGSSDYWIVKADKEGQYEWSKTFGGVGVEELRAVIQTNEGGFLLGGKSDSGVSGDRTQPSQGGSDYWLVKVTPEAKSIIAEREVITVAESKEKEEASLLKVYPNPAKDQVIVRFTLSQTQDATLKLYDIQGREIKTLFEGESKANQKYEVIWQAHNQATGMYLLRLDTVGKSHTTKLLLTR